MKKGNYLLLISISLIFVFSTTAHAASKNRRIIIKAVISEIDGYSITAVKQGSSYIINAERATLRSARNKRATIDQFLAGDQIDVIGRRTEDGLIIAKTVKNRSIKNIELTRRGVGAENIRAGAITNASIAENADISSSKIDFTNLDFGTSAIANGNFTGNWNFNGGNLFGLGTIGGGSITTSGIITAEGTGSSYFGGNVGIGITNPQATLSVNGQVNLKKNSAQPYECDSAHDGDIALTGFYATCVCKSGTGWIFSYDGTTNCSWESPGPRHLDPVLSGREMDFPLASNAVIQENRLVCANTGGYAVPCTDSAGFKFIGVSKEAVNNTGGANGAKWIRNARAGIFEFDAASITQAMVGTAQYVVNDYTTDDAAGPNNDIRVGVMVKYISATKCWVDITG